MTKFLKGRPTRSDIDHAALRWNLRQIQKKIGPRVKILSMVKANAYGHGAVAVARTLAKSGSDAFGVATVEEGIELRDSRIKQPILVLAGAYVEQLDELLEYKLTPVLHDSATLTAFERKARRRKIKLNFQLEVDTGMGRIGFPSAEIEAWLTTLAKLKALKLAGVFSHFSEAESANEKYAAKQLKTFQRVLDRLNEVGIVQAPAHMSKSAALITTPAANFSMVRPGLILYGMYPAANLKKQISLKPVLAWKTRIIQLKRAPIGTSIGYGRTFVTKRNSLIATLPVGYADGYRRLLSNRAQVLVRGKRVPVVGRVSMDLTTVDVTDIRNVQQGDEVVLLGRQGGGEISADEMAAWADTISYEIFTSIGARVPRIHINQ
ncbi:MAG: alanine racemase [Deltaproteobacteria bacterium]|nr:alanine racemase [Deltaproteobacteria bacterium]